MAQIVSVSVIVIELDHNARRYGRSGALCCVGSFDLPGDIPLLENT